MRYNNNNKMAEIWILRGKHEIFLLNFLNLICKNRNGVMVVNIFLKIFSQFFKIRVESPFKVWNYFMGQCLPNFFGKDSSHAKQYHPYYEFQIC